MGYGEYVCPQCKDTERIKVKRGGVWHVLPCPHCPPDIIDLDEDWSEPNDKEADGEIDFPS